MPTIEISEEAYALLKKLSDEQTAQMATSAGMWFTVDVDEIADAIIKRELDPAVFRDNEDIPF